MEYYNEKDLYRTYRLLFNKNKKKDSYASERAQHAELEDSVIAALEPASTPAKQRYIANAGLVPYRVGYRLAAE